MESSTYASDRRRPARWAKRCEQNCMAVVTRLPLVIVYGLTTWAIWVEFGLSIQWIESSKKGYVTLFFGITFYLLLNWSYTTCAFTDPGSPLNTSPSHRHNYSHLPSHEPQADVPSFTVKATGGARFCKKCQCKKPDRAHHCSSCRRCVLKMDHHCPWLATCVGLRNYKAFLLFLIYTTLFCWLCFGLSSSFIWSDLANQMIVNGGGLLGINMVLLAVLSGIIGLVLTGFTGWHVSLAIRNQTTIECLEKTRYSTPIKRTLQRATAMPHGEDIGLMQRYGQQFAEIHANAIPGVTRVEEGEERSSPHPNENLTAMQSLHLNYAIMEREREQETDRYERYLDEKDSEKLPHAFDLGWKRNLSSILGPAKHLWFLPICNSKGDGWQWEASPKWLAAHATIQAAREHQLRDQQAIERQAGWGDSTWKPDPSEENHWNNGSTSSSNTNATSSSQGGGRPSPPHISKADRILGRTAGQYSDGRSYDTRPPSEMSMQTFNKQNSDDTDTASIDGLYDGDDADDSYYVSSDEATAAGHGNRHGYRRRE